MKDYYGIKEIYCKRPLGGFWNCEGGTGSSKLDLGDNINNIDVILPDRVNTQEIADNKESLLIKFDNYWGGNCGTAGEITKTLHCKRRLDMNDRIIDF